MEYIAFRTVDLCQFWSWKFRIHFYGWFHYWTIFWYDKLNVNIISKNEVIFQLEQVMMAASVLYIFSMVFMIICSVIQHKNMDRLQLYVHNSRHRRCNKVPQLYITVGANSLIRLIEITFAISKAGQLHEVLCWTVLLKTPYISSVVDWFKFRFNN